MRLPVALLFAAQLRCISISDIALPVDCRDYVACAEKLGDTATVDAYGADSDCWTTQQETNRCVMDCQAGKQTLNTSGAAADAGCMFH